MIEKEEGEESKSTSRRITRGYQLERHELGFYIEEFERILEGIRGKNSTNRVKREAFRGVNYGGSSFSFHGIEKVKEILSRIIGSRREVGGKSRNVSI